MVPCLARRDYSQMLRDPGHPLKRELSEEEVALAKVGNLKEEVWKNFGFKKKHNVTFYLGLYISKVKSKRVPSVGVRSVRHS